MSDSITELIKIYLLIKYGGPQNVNFVFPYFPESARNVWMAISYHRIDSKSYDASILITLMNNNNCDSGV